MFSREDLRKSIESGEGVARVTKLFRGAIKGVSESSRTARFAISTGQTDRDNDVIEPTGWDLRNYEANPIVLWAHNSTMPPIGKASATGLVGASLKSTAQFATREEYELADTVFRLVLGGYLKAASVGFRPLESTWNHDRNGADFKRQELHEWSVVPVPANPGALVGAKSAGIDMAPLHAWAIATLDEVKGDDHPAARAASILYKSLKSTQIQIPAMADLPDEVQVTYELIKLGVPEVQSAIAAALAGDVQADPEAENLISIGDHDCPEGCQCGEGAASEGDPEPKAETSNDLDPNALVVLEADPASGGGQASDAIELGTVTPEEFQKFLREQVQMELSTATGKLPG